MAQYKVTYGGWYQRTTLHLSEIYGFFAKGTSGLDLSKEELKKFQSGLGLSTVSRESGYFEYVKATTKKGIEIRYYEDGLYILEIDTDDIAVSEKLLEEYLEKKLSPAISYIFSLGAPTPKVLANIKTVHPVVISINGGADFSPDEALFGEIYTKISSDKVTVYKTPKYILIKNTDAGGESLRGLIEMQVFFREFKDQLEKYLYIHRTIWEQISEIKEAKTIKGKEVEDVRGKLDGYQKTISLITYRINQMESYIETRSSIAKHLNIEKDLASLFEYKFETLTDTLSYIQEIWKMTTDYLSSAVKNLVEIKSESTSNNLKSLQTITSIGIISGLIGHMSASKWPAISKIGLGYFVILFTLTWLLNYLIAKKYKNKKYSLKFGDRASNL